MAFIDWQYTANFWKRKLGLGRKPLPKPKPKKNDKLAGIETPEKPTTQKSTWTTFDEGLIITDEEFLNADAMSEKDIQDFLVKKKGVILPEYEINGHLASYWMNKHCKELGLNPKVLMTHMQKEMGAITRKSPYKKQRTYDYILGVGATDGGDKSKWAGVDKQILGAVKTCIKWHQRGIKNNIYPMTFKASDNKTLIIKNSATYSLYKYTPWVGDKDKQIGRNLYRKPFGNLLFWRVYRNFFTK